MQESFPDFLEILYKKGKNRYFAFYRNPIDTVKLVARMLYHDTGFPYSKERSVLYGRSKFHQNLSFVISARNF